MSTFKFTKKTPSFTPLSNTFIDKYMPSARGEFVKVYIMGLRLYHSGELGINSSLLASSLHLLESDVMNAWQYWHDEGVINKIKIDNFDNFEIEFIDLDKNNITTKEVNLLSEMKSDSTRGMLEDIESLLGRPLSSAEMQNYLSWQKSFGFSPEMILLLIQYCVSKKKTDWRYIEKVAISWKNQGIDSAEKIQEYIKKSEDKWSSIRKILKYLGISEGEVMKPQEDMFDKWLFKYNMPLEVIFKACDICFKNINKADYKYIDAILNNWNKENLHSIKDIEAKSTTKKTTKPNYEKPKSRFFNFEERNYDYDELEKQLLGWDDND